VSDFFFHEPSNALIYPGTLPAHIAPFLPEAQQINGFFAVPRTLRNSIVLAQYNYPVMPVMDEYDWPIERNRKPLPHQKIYANFSVLHPKMLNLGDPGTMKTLSTLWAMDFMMRQFPPGTCRALIIAPLSTLETVWAAAIARNFPGRRSYKVLIGDAEKRTKLLAEPADCYIINHDGIKVDAHIKKRDVKRGEKRIELRGFSRALAERKDIRIVIADEASAYKDASTYRHEITRMVLGDRPFWWLLTGTPTPNSPADAHGLAKLVNNAYGKSFNHFRMETMIKVSDFKWVPQKDGYEKARRMLTPSVRFALDDVWDGPPMTFQRRKVELTADQKRHMNDLKNNLQVLVRDGKSISADNEAAARQKFIQISLGMIYDGDHKAHPVDAKPRYDELYDIISSTQRKVVVFVVITAAIHLMMDYLKKRWKADKLPYKCCFINGEVSAKQRPVVIKSFAEDECMKVVVADPVAAGHGINDFVAADTVVWASATDKAESWIQGNGRVRRPGQKYPSTCYQLVSNKLEEEIFDRLETNTGMQGMMLAAIREGKF
jgi:SNF2 family DNA or RNA helicase